mmetsp:Transcript_58960/g.133490  ORF Transcript_58960/g.133490 Transcript_58960/m.133490 type:complete len:232 (+) Transcript_58960:124-819(+)
MRRGRGPASSAGGRRLGGARGEAWGGHRQLGQRVLVARRPAPPRALRPHRGHRGRRAARTPRCARCGGRRGQGACCGSPRKSGGGVVGRLGVGEVEEPEQNLEHLEGLLRGADPDARGDGPRGHVVARPQELVPDVEGFGGPEAEEPLERLHAHRLVPDVHPRVEPAVESAEGEVDGGVGGFEGVLDPEHHLVQRLRLELDGAVAGRGELDRLASPGHDPDAAGFADHLRP